MLQLLRGGLRLISNFGLISRAFSKRTLPPGVLTAPVRSCALSAALVLVLALLPVGANAQNAYITNQGNGTVSVINTATNTVTATVPIGTQPYGVAVTPDGTKAYITDVQHNTASVIDTANNTVVATIPVGNGASGIAVNPDGSKAYVANLYDNTVSVIDTASNAVIAAIPVGRNPIGVAVSPDSTKVYVTNGSDDTVSIINTVTNTVAATVPVGHEPNGIAITPDGAKAYVANHRNANSVSVIDTASNTVVATISVGDFPVGVAVTPDGTKAYVGNNDGIVANGTISVIDTATNTVTTTITVGYNPTGISYTPDGARAYVANNYGNTVSVIDTGSNTVVATIPGFNSPIAYGNFIGGPAHGSPPVITANPSNVTVIAGQTAIFTAAATGTPTPTVQWQQSTDGGATYTNVPGAPSTAYSFTAALSQNGYKYRAVFTNPSGTAATTAATITVTPPPPSISSVSPSTVTGSNSPQQFTINGTNFVTGANITLRDLTAGQTFPNLVASSFSSTQIVINPVFTTAAHNWSVEVINPDGQSSGQFPFQVIAPPAPSISSVSPNPVRGSNSPQPFTINGANFVTGANITLRDLTAVKTFANLVASSFSSSQIVVSQNFTPAPHNWSVEVINPDGQSSGQFPFSVIKPPRPPPCGGPGFLPPEVHLIDPYLLDAYKTNPAKIPEASLYGIYNNPAVQAAGLVADGVSAAIAVVKVNDCTADLSVFVDDSSPSGITLFRYDDKFLQTAPSNPGATILPFTAAELAANGGFAVVLVQAPMGGPAPSFTDPIIVTARQGGETAFAPQLDLVPPPVVLVHGLWGDRASLGGGDGAGSGDGLAHYLKTTAPWSSRPVLVTTLCYSKYIGFNQDTDPPPNRVFPDPSFKNNPCEQTSKSLSGNIMLDCIAF